MNFKELESCIESVGDKPIDGFSTLPITSLSYLSSSGQGIYGLKPLIHCEVLQRGVSKYIENKSKKEKSDIIQYLLGEDYKPKYEKYFSRSWQKSHSKYPIRFEQLPAGPKYERFDKYIDVDYFQGMILRNTRLVRTIVRYKGGASIGESYRPLRQVNGISDNSINIESYNPLTNSQRRFILDYIDRLHFSPEHIFIDDHSEEQSIKRQLGLQFF